jgi:ribosomal peptide maturation radical SAM protein 1
MKLALISLPWSMLTQPGAAIGALAAYVRREAPHVHVDARYEYVRVAAKIGPRLYDGIAHRKHELGELLYTPLLYPDRADAVREHFVAWASERFADLQPRWMGVESWAELNDSIQRGLAAHLDELVGELAGHDVVGLTTCYGQYFPNLAFAQRLKQRAPGVHVVLGGSTVSARVGPSTLREYPWIDTIVQGEGEAPLVALLDALAAGRALDDLRGVLTRATIDRDPNGAPLWEVRGLDALPLPDYREYADQMAALKLEWTLPLEGSRGCWWDRTRRAGNPKSTCYFCNLNVQWGGYREKSIDRLVDELKELSDRYGTTQVYFLDNIIRHDGAGTLAERIRDLGRDYELFYEMRANIQPHDLVLLWEAGLREAQIGVEGLSTSYLRRIGKGTTAIQNLQAMKICYELDITHGANVILSFPSSTEAEVRETVATIERWALGFQPCNPCEFHLAIDSSVDKLRDEFGVTEVRNADCFRIGLPPDVYERVQLFDLSFSAPCADWTPVREACKAWIKPHAATRGRLFTYHDGGTFLRLVDRRTGLRSSVLRGLAREVYLWCGELRTLDRVFERFARTEPDRARIRTFLDRSVAQNLMAEENGRYLALACAPNARAAARRIRAHHAEQPRAVPRPRLPVVTDAAGSRSA